MGSLNRSGLVVQGSCCNVKSISRDFGVWLNWDTVQMLSRLVDPTFMYVGRDYLGMCSSVEEKSSLP